MKNWEETHECEDKRDEERLRKRIAATSESVAMTNALAVQKTQSRTEDSDDDDTFLPLSKKNPFKDFVVLQAIHVLEQAEWLISPFHSAKIMTSSATSLKKDSPFSKISASQLKLWMTSVKNQERIITQLQQNSSSTHLQPHSKVDINETEGSDSFFNFPSIILPDNCRAALVEGSIHPVENKTSSAEELINKIGEDHHLQPEQWIAFCIISRHFLENHITRLASTKKNPLRMLLTGPGGTGKSHVVKAVQKLMEHYRAGHTIRFLAPTGTAASLIDGMTIHKGLGIKVKSAEKGKGNRKLGDNHEDYSVIITARNKTKLRDEWRLVETVMIDECSLLSAELLSEIDAALRFAKEVPDEWFGGITVIFAGDFFQYPPVCATPLYNPITNRAKSSDSEVAKRIG